MSIYLESGFLDYPKIINMHYPLTIIYGGRGTGKTYGALKYQIVNQDNEPFFYMRRTGQQLKAIKKPELNPFDPINTDYRRNIMLKSTDDFIRILDDDKEDPDTGDALMVGYAVALSTFANLRGFGAAWVKRIIYDEFIPEKHEKKIKYEADALWNAWETVNRNRELLGVDPVQLVLLSNSNELANPIFMSLGIVEIARKLRSSGRNIYQDRQRGLLLVDMYDSPISRQKSDTAIYRAVGTGSEFGRMALQNEFAFDDISPDIRSRKLAAYAPVVRIGEITIYKHKSDKLWYVTTHYSGAPEIYTSGETDKKRFIRKYWMIWNRYLDGCVEFETYTCQALFEGYFGER